MWVRFSPGMEAVGEIKGLGWEGEGMEVKVWDILWEAYLFLSSFLLRVIFSSLK